MGRTSWSRCFPGRPDQIREVRRFVAAVADGAPVVDQLVLAASEMATNAILHSRSGAFTVAVTAGDRWFRVQVDDAGGESTPRIRRSGDLQEDGIGLVLISATAKESGVSGDSTSRRVWADFASG